eukprot:Phypoly_transcript_06914.p1 GENE.Phypoly_transcript_06914~~Phypoly_transcript_06914.p1  ORF type:complete len:353 (+),score=53.68 Phypoly_transcript_06914:613-1671(+)
MKAILLLFALFVFCTFAEEHRLLQFSETYTEWVPVSVVEKLMCLPEVHFMDVTDFSYDKRVTADPLPLPTAPRFQSIVNPILNSINIARVTSTITSMSEYYTRYFRSETGVEAAKWLKQQYTFLSEHRPEITVVNFTSPNFPQASVIATIPGSGPNKDNVVILGGHLDSVGSTTTGRSPGADDDASGSASVLEAFRVLVEANYKPDFTLQFMGYAAEEGGLLGSQAIAADYLKREVPVYAVLQLDMTGYTSTGNPSVGIVTDYTNGELNGFVRQLVSTYTSLAQSNKQCGYACSDHASWNRTGYRSSFPFETVSNPSIHSANDVITRLNNAQMLQFVRLAVSFAIELAGVAN